MIEPKMMDSKARSMTWTGPSTTSSNSFQKAGTATNIRAIDTSKVPCAKGASDKLNASPPNASPAEVMGWANALLSTPTGSVVADITHPSTGYSAPSSLVRHYLDSAVAKYKQPKTYSKKVLLTIHWQDDDCKAKEDSLKMEKLMKDVFHFDEVEREELPQKNPQGIARSKIINTIARHDSEEGSEAPSLFVFHYAGHGRYQLGDAKTREKTLEIGGLYSGQVWIPFEPMRDEMMNCHGDVLIIMDCCYSAIVTRGGNSGRTVEIVAAGGEMEEVGIGNKSFTHFFTLAARALAQNGQPFSVECLHRMMVRGKPPGPKLLPVIQSAGSDMSRNTSTSSDTVSLSSATSHDSECPNFGPVYNEDGQIYSRVPFYQKREGSESIKLHPCNSTSKKVATLPTTGLLKGEVLVGIIIHVTEDSSSSEVEKLTKHIHEQLSVREGFTATVIKKIRSESTLILAAIPSPIYECLPSHPALVYIGTIATDDPSITPVDKPPLIRKPSEVPSALIVTKRSLVSIPRMIWLNKRPSFNSLSKPLTNRLFGSDIVALGRLVTNIDASEPDYCPILPGELVNINNVVEMSVRIPRNCGRMKKHDQFVLNTKLTDLFSGALGKRGGTTFGNDGASVGRAYSMTDAASCFQSMRKQSVEIRQWIEKFNKLGPIYMVVAIATFRKVTQAEEGKTFLRSAEEHNSEKERCVSSPGDEETVFAIEYQKVQFGWLPGHRIDKASLAKHSHLILREDAENS